MSFMQMMIYNKARTYTVECSQCGHATWFHPDTCDIASHVMADPFLFCQAVKDTGRFYCDDCTRPLADGTVHGMGKQYAGRYSAPGYMDCTDWHYSRNLATLKRELRDMYGDQ